jgi:hypothetical protein
VTDTYEGLSAMTAIDLDQLKMRAVAVVVNA